MPAAAVPAVAGVAGVVAAVGIRHTSHHASRIRGSTRSKPSHSHRRASHCPDVSVRHDAQHASHPILPRLHRTVASPSLASSLAPRPRPTARAPSPPQPPRASTRHHHALASSPAPRPRPTARAPSTSTSGSTSSTSATLAAAPLTAAVPVAAAIALAAPIWALRGHSSPALALANATTGEDWPPRAEIGQIRGRGQFRCS